MEMKSSNIKRAVSVLLAMIAMIFTLMSIHTNVWWERATPAIHMSDSFIYMWKGLQEVCVKLKADAQAICTPISHTDWSIETTVTWFLYTSVAVNVAACLAVLLMLVCLKRLLMDVLTVLYLISGVLSIVGLSIYTHENPTHVALFDLFGYSYIFGWLGVTCYMTSSLFSFLSRINEDDLARKEMKK